MSFIQRDFSVVSLMSFNQKSRLYQRFKRAWSLNGSHYVYPDGVKCYDSKYKWSEGGTTRSTTADKKFYEILGSSFSELDQSSNKEMDWISFDLHASRYQWSPASPQQIHNAIYTAFDKNYKVPNPDYDPQEPAGEPEFLYPNADYDGEFTVTVDYGGDMLKYVDGHLNEYELVTDGVGNEEDATLMEVVPFNKVEVRSILESNPWRYFGNVSQLVSDIDSVDTPAHNYQNMDHTDGPRTVYFKAIANTPVTKQASTRSQYGSFALVDSGGIFEKVGGVFNERVYTVSTDLERGEVLGYKYSQKYRYVGSSPGNPTVLDINKVAIDIESEICPKIVEEGTIYERCGNQTVYTRSVAPDTLIKKSMYKLADIPEWSDAIWQRGYLKVDAAEKMARWEFADLFSKCIDTDYEEADAEWYEIFLAIVIVIIAIVIAVFTAGAGGVAAWGLTQIALGLSYAAMVFSIGAMLLSVVGGPSANNLVKIIGYAAQITGIAAFVLGLASWATSAYQAKALAAQQAGTIQSTADYTIKQFIQDMISDVIDNVVDSVVDAVTNTFDFLSDIFTGDFSSMSNISLNDVSGFMDNLDTAYKTYMEYFHEPEQVDTTLQEQTSKSNQFPEEWAIQYEIVVYEQDALQRMDILKEKELGGNKTQAFLDQIA